MTTINADSVRLLYRQMQQSGATTGNEAIYVRPEIKTELFGEQTHLDVDSISLPIIVDTRIPESDVGSCKQSELYILDQEAFIKACRSLS